MASPKESRQAILRSSRRYYARRASYYDLVEQGQKRDAETPRQLDFLEFAFRSHATRPVRRVLDVACGGGRHAVGLAQRGYECTGRDFTSDRIDIARARAARAGVQVQLSQGDATRLTHVRAFDAVLAAFILFLLPSDEDVQRCLRGIHRALRPGGVIVCNVYNPFGIGKDWVSSLLRGGQRTSRYRTRGIAIRERETLHAFDRVHGVAWVEETSTIEAPDGRHVFRDRERVRLFTYWDLSRYLSAAGFRDVRCYPDWASKPPKNPRAEELVFVARK